MAFTPYPNLMTNAFTPHPNGMKSISPGLRLVAPKSDEGGGTRYPGSNDKFQSTLKGLNQSSQSNGIYSLSQPDDKRIRSSSQRDEINQPRVATRRAEVR